MYHFGTQNVDLLANKMIVRPIRVELWDSIGRMDWAIIEHRPCTVNLIFARLTTSWFIKVLWNNGDITYPPCSGDADLHKDPAQRECVLRLDIV